ncbi:MAG: peptide deformylase [Deltaproteobacteria bacterium]|nr:peptide deformylase [Deltaproteobacteria bacterium]
MILRTTTAVLLLSCALLGCGGADESTPTQEQDPGNAELLIASVAPGAAAVVGRNEKITITFHYPVVVDTLVVELAGQLVPLATLDDREFRFVPFPLHTAGATYEVTIAAGLEDSTGQILDRDYTWSFETEAAAIESEPPPPLTEAEIALITSGAVDVPMDLVTSYDDPQRALYDISPPMDVESEHLPLFVDRMMTSVVAHGGIGLAAPQVGINRRLFVARIGGTWQTFINPSLDTWSPELDQMEEACLSVPETPANVARPVWIDASSTRADGSAVSGEHFENTSAAVYPARLWLHEFDHLNGILLIDRMGTPPAETL